MPTWMAVLAGQPYNWHHFLPCLACAFAGANLAQLLSSMPGGWAGAGMGGAGNANDLMAQLTSLNSQLGLGGLGGQGLGDMFSRLGDLTSQLPPFGGGKRGG
jgi:hypothetical protein